MFLLIWFFLLVVSWSSVIFSSVLEACRNNNHINGSWVPITISFNKSFICCGGLNKPTKETKDSTAENDFLQMKDYCGQTNTVMTYVEKGPNNGRSAQCGDDCCKCDREDGTRLIPGKREKYAWIPYNCTLQPWNATRFCEFLGSRVLLLVGDSTMQQTASTLMSMVSSNGGTCGPRIIFGRNDYISLPVRNQKHFGELLYYHNPDVAIISVGAHIADAGDFGIILAALRTHIEHRSTYGKVPKLIFKSNNPPHLGCEIQETPIDQFFPNPKKLEDQYNYERLYHLDHFMLSYARNASNDPTFKFRNNSNDAGFNYISMEPLYLRPDAHVYGAKKDCLHYCQPGPLDLFSILLQQMLINGEI